MSKFFQILALLFVFLFVLAAPAVAAYDAGDYIRAPGDTSQMIDIFVPSTVVLATTGAGLTGLTSASGSLTCYYHRSSASSSTVVSLQSSTLGTYTSGMFKEVDATNMPGIYEFGIPDAAIASGAQYASFTCRGAANMEDTHFRVRMVTFGVNVTQWSGTNVTTPNTAGTPVVDATRILGTTIVSPATAGYFPSLIKDGMGTGEIDTNAGAVVAVTTATTCTTASTCSAIGSGGITTASFASGAIDAAAIAANAIGASEIADGAIDAGAIADGALTEAKFGSTGTFQAASTTTDLVLASGETSNDITGQTICGTSGNMAKDCCKVSAYNGTTKHATCETAVSQAPANGDSYTIGGLVGNTVAPLTSGQTASSVLDATQASYNTAGSIGAAIGTSSSGVVSATRKW